MVIKIVPKPDLKLISTESGLPGTTIPFNDFPNNLKQIPLTEDDIAEEFAKQHSNNLLYDHEQGFWFKWNDICWEIDKTKLTFHFARLLCRKHRGSELRMASRKAAEGVEVMARSDTRLAATSSSWDTNPYLLGTPTGTVDLKTGELKKANRSDYITRSTSVGPAAVGTPAPIFFQFLSEITGGDKDLGKFLQQWLGYCLTGDTKLQCLLFIYGTGGNGKGILMNMAANILGTYAKTAAMDTFTATKQSRHLTELAMLRGTRLVTVPETEKGQAWSESRINQLTGGDPITANFMRRDHFTYIPQFKLTISGNHKPKLNSLNEAARRRYNIVPFNHKPPSPDTKLSEKLRPEYPAILRWMIDGCLDLQKNGLTKPDILVETTAEYFDEQNLLKQWITARCKVGHKWKSSAKELFKSWKLFCEEANENPGTQTSFGTLLGENGYKKTKSGTTIYLGITPDHLA